MTPAARVHAAIDILDMVLESVARQGAAADTLIAQYFKTRRYAGSADRRAVRAHVYAAIRTFSSPPPTGRAAMVALADADPLIAASFDGSAHGPAPMVDGEPRALRAADPVPAWLHAHLPPLLDMQARGALLERAPLHVRVNMLKTTREALHADLPEGSPLPATADGMAFPEGTDLEATAAWQAGLIEVQDAGSQIIASACRARPGQTVLDLCAGAGGKTLALAADMAGQGRLIAADINRDRLSRLRPRAIRAGAGFIETLLLNGGREEIALRPLAGLCDAVLVDAPCTGMGTWRRNPEARWRLTPAMLARMTALQAHVLDLAVPLVRPGGALVYAVCSLLDAEGRAQIEAFLARHTGWLTAPVAEAGRAHGPGTLLTPANDGCDGFFVARLEKA